MNHREVMQKALEALGKTMNAWGGTCAWHGDVKQAINALKDSLEVPTCCCGEPSALGSVHRTDGPCYLAEPVAWFYRRGTDSAIAFAPDRDPDKPWQPLYASPQRRPHELLCVCGCIWQIRADGKEALVATTPQRQPLTDEEIVDIWADVSMGYDDEINIIELARAIERAHGIKGETK